MPTKPLADRAVPERASPQEQMALALVALTEDSRVHEKGGQSANGVAGRPASGNA